MIEAAGVCDNLMRNISDRTSELLVHSVFDNAMNFSSDCGMITLLAPDKGLLPHAILLRDRLDFHTFANNRSFRIDRCGILADGQLSIDFSRARHESLRLNHPVFPESFCGARALSYLQMFLAAYMGKGLVELVFDRHESPYAHYLYPRFCRFRKIAQTGEDKAFIAAAYEIAGCGEGLTPSSDDLLSGYLLCASATRKKAVIKKAAYRAAAHTNDISAALLRHGGDGLFSKDILDLIGCLATGGSVTDVFSAFGRVAAFGSSSGCDFLTGLYFGIYDFWAGKEAMQD